MKPKLIALLLIVGVGIGLAISAQLQAKPSRVNNPVSPFLALEESKSSLEKSQTDLKEKIKTLRDSIKKNQSESRSSQSASESIINEDNKLKSDAGYLERRGGGVVITLADSQSSEPTIDSIVHAADIRDLVNVLWLTGATAIEVNSERVVLNTSIDSIVNTILVNNTKITNPFIIKASGDKKKLSSAVQSNSILADLRRREKSFNLIINVEESNDVSISAFDGGIPIINAKIKED